MNKTTKPAANPTLGVCSYESPALNVVEVHSEGVLCSSVLEGNTLSVEDWENGSFSW
jgi:hypothetical protein